MDIAITTGTIYGFGSLAKAVDHFSPQVTYQDGHLPHEILPVQDPMLTHPKQRLAQIISGTEQFVLKAVGLTTDLNHPR